MKSRQKSDISLLRQRLTEIAHLSFIDGIVGWDQEVNMPQKSADVRAQAVAELSGIIHGKYLAIDHDGLLSRLHTAVIEKKIRGKEAVVIEETWRTYQREKKLPEALVRELAEVTSKAQVVWAEARTRNDFRLFSPYLKKIVALKRAEAEAIGYSDSPYDVLLDEHEPGMTTRDAAIILNDLKDFLIPFLRTQKAQQRKQAKVRTQGKFSRAEQERFNRYVAERIGFDFAAGRLDESTHPFTAGNHPFDVRITTRYKDDDVWYALGSTVHEIGHALYDQGLPHEHFGTPLGEPVSLGVHESQSRLWENHIGKSSAFWRFFYPKLQKTFPVPYAQIPLADFYRLINEVQPSLIRTEADEVTYNLHIIIRFEIEREMIEGTIAVTDVPAIWRAKVKEYLGIEVPSDALGCLQDVHWAAGLIGYFPTYSFGNLYAAQLYAAMERQIPHIDALMKKGSFSEIREWLRTHIHKKGKLHTAAELIRTVTGEVPTSRYFAEYIKKKYTQL